MNVNLKLIRDQIQSPSQVLLPHWGVSNNLSFPDENLGVNIVKHPKELRAFLIVFDLKTAKSITRYGVLLPGPTNPGLSIYRWLAENNRGQQDMRINATHIPRDNYLTNPTLAFASHGFWNAVVND